MSKQKSNYCITQTTQFGQSIDSLVQKVDWVPVGWQRAYRKMILRLRGTICPGRADLIFVVRPITIHGLNICMSVEDQTVEGIIRKTNKTMACTCSICGKKGRRGRVGTVRHTLCATCLAPRQLQQEVKQMLRRLDPKRITPDVKRIFTFDDLAPCLPMLIPESSWSKLTCDQSGLQLRCVARLDLLDLKPKLNDIQKFLSELILMGK